MTCWRRKKEEKSFRNSIKTTPRSKTTTLSQDYEKFLVGSLCPFIPLIPNIPSDAFILPFKVCVAVCEHEGLAHRVRKIAGDSDNAAGAAGVASAGERHGVVEGNG